VGIAHRLWPRRLATVGDAHPYKNESPRPAQSTIPSARPISSIATRLRRARTAPHPVAKIDNWHKSLCTFDRSIAVRRPTRTNSPKRPTSRRAETTLTGRASEGRCDSLAVSALAPRWHVLVVRIFFGSCSEGVTQISPVATPWGDYMQPDALKIRNNRVTPRRHNPS
jgi:hypothetical protein